MRSKNLNKINLFSPINSLGYGVVGYNVWKQLNKTHDVTLWPIPDERNIVSPVEIKEEDIYQIRIDIDKQNIFDPDSPCLKIWHENQMAERIGHGKFFAFPFFEVEKFNPRRKTHLSSADEIIVASNWARDVLIKNDFTQPIHVVECGVDRSIFNESNNVFDNNKCVFFNCGKWEVRKGHDVLHKAFKDAFSSDENVELWMMTENPFLNQDEKQKFEKNYQASNIKILPRVQYQQELAGIMNKVFCGVFPSRAEGWNLEALEIMSCGKELIITNCSAHMQFCNNSNSHLINIPEKEPAYDGKWFIGDNGEWASLSGEPYDQLVESFRKVYQKWQQVDSNYLNHNGIETSKKLSWERCSRNLSSIIFGE